MKNTYRILTSALIITAFFLGGLQARAQTFSMVPKLTSLSGTPGQLFEPFAEVTNLTSNALQVRVIKNVVTMPSGWAVSFCLANCFSPEATDVVDELGPNQTFSLKMTFETGSTAGDAEIEMILSSVDNPTENYSVTFYVTTGTSSGTGQNALPKVVAVSQNYPNPLSISSGVASTINFTMPKAGHVAIRVYNLLGQELRALVNDVRPAGAHSVAWDGRDRNGGVVLPGIYLYKLSTSGANITRRMLVTR